MIVGGPTSANICPAVVLCVVPARKKSGVVPALICLAVGVGGAGAGALSFVCPLESTGRKGFVTAIQGCVVLSVCDTEM